LSLVDSAIPMRGLTPIERRLIGLAEAPEHTVLETSAEQLAARLLVMHGRLRPDYRGVHSATDLGRLALRVCPVE
jgi:hypothetical protein